MQKIEIKFTVTTEQEAFIEGHVKALMDQDPTLTRDGAFYHLIDMGISECC